MASSEEQTSSTVSTRAGSSNSAPEEFSVEPHPGGSAAKGTVEVHPPDSEPLQLADPQPPEQPEVPPEQDMAELKRKPLPKVNAVAREVHLKATGARHGAGAGIRELFTESTTTVLIFEKGAVIRLSAAVAPRQLLVLTNEETKRELVAHVVRKRIFRPMECYVEVEFSESAPGFWGVEFSAATALLPKDEKEAAAIELVASAETTTDELTGAAPQPSPDEVQALKKEVATLRGQPGTLATPPSSGPATALPPTPAAPNKVSAPANQSATPRTLTSKSLPIDREPEPVRPAIAHQMPVTKPADFQYSPPKGKRSSRARGQFTPGFRAGLLRLTALLLILGGLVGVSWYKHWLPWLNAPKAAAAPSKTSGTPPPAPRPAAPAPSEVSTSKSAAASETAPSTTPAATQPSPESPNGAEPESAAENKTGSEPSLPVEPAARPLHSAKPAPAAPSAKRSLARSSPTKSVDTTPSAAQQSAIVPPKLIKSVPAIASLSALHDFERGDVVIDALIDESGNVKSMKVLSGPPSLHPPAMEALKNYKYEPATLNGKPVPAHVTVKIQFRYEP